MKKCFVLSVLMIVSLGSYSQSFSGGAALVYGDDIEQFGIHLRGYYNLRNDKICFGPEFSTFFTQKETIGGETIAKKLDEINFNVHYVFEINESLGFYPLTGLNLSFEKEEIEMPSGPVEIQEEAFGVNLGFGLHKLIGKTVLFVEFDHLFSKLSQNSALVGFFYMFGKKEE